MHGVRQPEGAQYGIEIFYPNDNELRVTKNGEFVLASGDYTRWLSDEPNPRDLMRPFPAEPMPMWLISTRVNKPENDDPSIVEPIEQAAATA